MVVIVSSTELVVDTRVIPLFWQARRRGETVWSCSLQPWNHGQFCAAHVLALESFCTASMVFQFWGGQTVLVQGNVPDVFQDCRFWQALPELSGRVGTAVGTAHSASADV